MVTQIPTYGGPSASRDYAPGTEERGRLDAALLEVQTGDFDIPNVIGGREVRTAVTGPIRPPHAHANVVGCVHHAATEDVDAAIEAAVSASGAWRRTPWQERADIFLRAADLLEHGTWRERLTAATMIELSKTVGEAEGDGACETADFMRANVANMVRMYQDQPQSTEQARNAIEYRPLEGFVLAISPFNFTSMNNLAFGPALLGNTVVWKPAESASLVAHLSYELLREAGLPDGVVNVLYGRGSQIGPRALAHRDLAAVSFTGSTATFQGIWRQVGSAISGYRSYPRLVGETGGKGFVLVHPSADVDDVIDLTVKAAYGYQGQKCSAATRLYAPRSLWPNIRDGLIAKSAELVIGDPTVTGTDLGAVINDSQFRLHEAVLQRAASEGRVLAGGHADGSVGWFVEPTLVEVTDPHSFLMTEEFFGPILTAFVYDDDQWPEAVRLADESTPYGLTGAVFAQDPVALEYADEALCFAAGNFYVNDKPSGAVVGQQPFGGARASGTNDKVGTVWNLIRFVSPRTVKTRLST